MVKASFWCQFKALLGRNLLLKWRNRKQTIQEFLMPIYFVLLLALIKWLTNPKSQPPITSTVAFSLNNREFIPNFKLLFSPNSSDVRELAPKLGTSLGTSSYMVFDTPEDVEDYYRNNRHLSLAAVLFSNGLPTGMLNYTIRLPYASVAKSWQIQTNDGQCRESGIPQGNCLANSFLYSGFARIQLALDTLLLQLTSPGPLNLTQPDISAQIMPKGEYLPNVLSIQILSAIYFVLAYAPFVSFLSTNLVYEKEKRLKEAMRMMGMRDSAFWLSWALLYIVMIAAVSAVVVLIILAVQFFSTNSNVFIFFLALFLYGLSIVSFSFAITPFFNRADTAGALASLATVLFSMPYFIYLFTRTGGTTGESAIPVWGLYLMCLISPLALALAADQALLLDVLHGGMNFETINRGVFPLSSMLIMLAVDAVLYGLLAFYLDNIVPNEFGFRRKPWFFLTPSYWCPREATDPEEFALIGSDQNGVQENAGSTVNSENMEAIAPELRNKNMLRIFNLKKTYKTKKKEVKAVDGLSLDIYEGQITALLGHNGAGKTTLLNMLTGMTPPTSGTATLYGLDVSDMNDLNVLRTMIGYCPQHNILFDDLTPQEHFEYYAGIKGIPEAQRQKEVEVALRHVDLYEQRNTVSKQLSGGQKRKACVGIALIGNPKIMFLDEPTAGMDPSSRRHLWRLLQQQRDKLIVLTTHFMDEADILADRKAMISRGQLRCVGSSLFLKLRYGVGYHLSMVLEPSASAEDINQFVQGYVPEADYHKQHGKELVITLPVTSVSTFPELFGALEAGHEKTKSEELGIQTYGVSMTNLEEVFLKLGQEDEVDDDEDAHQANGGSFDNQPINNTTVTMETNNATVEIRRVSSPTDVTLLTDESQLRWQRFRAIYKLRFTQLFRNVARFVFQFVFPIVYMVGGACLLKFIPRPSLPQPQQYRLTPLTLTNSSMSSLLPNMLYSIPDSPTSQEQEFVDKLESQSLVMESYNDMKYVIDNAPHFLGFNMTSITQTSQVLSSVLTALYNTTKPHSLPSILNAFSTTLQNMIDPSAADPIVTNCYPWPLLDAGSAGFNGAIFGAGMFIGMALAYIPPAFGINIIRERETKARNQLRLSGVTSTMYWVGTFAFDGFQFFITCVLAFIIIQAFQIPGLTSAGAIISLALLFILVIPSNILLAYAMSFIFSKYQTAQSALPNIYIWLSMLPYFAVTFLDFGGQGTVASAIHYTCCVLIPSYNFWGGLYYISRVYDKSLDRATITIGDYFDWKSNIPITLLMPIVHGVFLFFLLRVLDVRSGGGNWRDAFRWSESNKIEASIPQDNADIPHDEDDDVAAERARVNAAVTSADSEAIKVVNLRKEFKKEQKTGCSGEKKSEKIRIAVRNTSLLVEKGEVLGLLGPNGAGKTTTLNMIIADIAPTKGKVYVAGLDIQSNLSSAYQAMGYCPQHDAIWDLLTLREHLECHANVRGIPKHQVPDVIDYYLESLRIKEHTEKQAKKLSGGTKRKLSYIMSMLGDPKVVLLDEPSTGMDPKSKRFLWDTISSAFNNDRRGAILTTHYMDEADALSSRVAIMVNGEVECVGTTQELKQKYGGGYQLEVKLSAAGSDEQAERNMEKLNNYITQVFPGAERREIFGDRALYQVPASSVKSLSQTFAALEKGKQELGVEEYSFSQATLEQVFLEFAKHQIDEEQEEADRERSSSALHQSLRLRRQLSIQSNPPSTDL